ncbi:MAG: hypothetical protein EPO11_10930 [Gammaproteobacteria bacterium]|nr:MAG: hypothetical protein EPO11_10930 [Gammaproteobacteria bacterium]
MKPEDFLIMAKTSTQVKRAIANIGEQKVDELILENINLYRNESGMLDVPYNARLYMAKK